MDMRIEYCGEEYVLDPVRQFYVGRQGDLVIDDNPLLHPQILRLVFSKELWWIQNVGSHLAAMLATPEGDLHAWIGPGAQLPMIVQDMKIRLVAGPTTYEFFLYLDTVPIAAPAHDWVGGQDPAPYNPMFSLEQRMLLLALMEPVLSDRFKGVSDALSSLELAARLGWSVTKFNRKLDAICEKLESLGVRGLHGAQGHPAANRKARLVEYLLVMQYFAPNDLEELQVYLSSKVKAKDLTGACV